MPQSVVSNKDGKCIQQEGEISVIHTYQEEVKGKFALIWQGPYVVHQVLLGGALILAEMDGRVSMKPINLDAIKRYYI